MVRLCYKSIEFMRTYDMFRGLNDSYMRRDFALTPSIRIIYEKYRDDDSVLRFTFAFLFWVLMIEIYICPIKNA